MQISGEFLITVVANVLSITIAFFGLYNKIDKRLTIIETEMQHKINYDKLLEKLDEVKNELKSTLRQEVIHCRDINNC